MNFLAVGDSDGNHHQVVVGDRVGDPISTNAHAVAIAFPNKLFASDRPRFFHRSPNARPDALSVFLLVNGLNLLGRGRLDQDPIACDAA